MKKTRPTHSRLDPRKPSGRRLVLAASVLALALFLVAAMPGLAAPNGGREAGRLYLDLGRMAKLTSRQVRPAAARVAGALPDAADRLKHLREPASTAETQLSIVLGELQQMSALTYDPHYMPALVAAGRAFIAVTGQDPLTRTAINPEYLGLDHELASDASGAEASGQDAAKALRGVKRLNRELLRSKRRAGRLERQLRRMRARGTGARSK